METVASFLLYVSLLKILLFPLPAFLFQALTHSSHTHKPQTARHETAEYQKWYKTADIFTLQNCYLNNSLMTRQLELFGAIKIFSTTCQLFYFFLESSSIEYMNLSRLNLYRHFDPRLIFGFSCKLNGEKCHSVSVSLAHSLKKSCKKISTAFNSPASWVFRICWFGPEWRQEDRKDELRRRNTRKICKLQNKRDGMRFLCMIFLIITITLIQHQQVK